MNETPSIPADMKIPPTIKRSPISGEMIAEVKKAVAFVKSLAGKEEDIKEIVEDAKCLIKNLNDMSVVAKSFFEKLNRIVPEEKGDPDAGTGNPAGTNSDGGGVQDNSAASLGIKTS